VCPLLRAGAPRLGGSPSRRAQPAAREGEVALQRLRLAARIGEARQLGVERGADIGQFPLPFSQFVLADREFFLGFGEFLPGPFQFLFALFEVFPGVGELLAADRVVGVQRGEVAGDGLQAVAHAFEFGQRLFGADSGNRPFLDLLFEFLLKLGGGERSGVFGVELEFCLQQFRLCHGVGELFEKLFELGFARIGEPFAFLRLAELVAHFLKLGAAAAQFFEDDRRRSAIEQRPLSHVAGLAVRRHSDQHRQHGRHQEVAHDDEDRAIHFSSPPQDSSFLRSGKSSPRRRIRLRMMPISVEE